MFWIIVCFATGLWPVGLFLLLQKTGVVPRFNDKTVGRVSTTWAVVMALAGIWAMDSISGAMGGFLLIGAAAMAVVAALRKRRERRDRKYQAIAAHRVSVSLREIARAIPTTVSEAARDIERLIAEGAFGDGAYLDMSRKVLVLDSAQAARAADVYQSTYMRADEDEEIVVEPEPKQEEKAQAPKSEDEYERKLEQIRKVNRDIADQEVSRKIYRIEAITSGIFTAVKNDPAKLAQAQTFMNYYLPTTLKLLTRYAQLEKTASPGPNVRSAMRNISEILDKLVQSFEELLDKLYQNDVIDITSEISALETMMARDNPSANPYSFEHMKK